MLASDTTVSALDDLSCVRSSVGYGTVGRHGDLGYDELRVVVGGVGYDRALSTHPPAHLVYDVPPWARRFTCSVAINDDVATSAVSARFTVVLDGRVVAHCVAAAAAGTAAIVADVAGGRRIELRVDTATWAYCHAVWLEPRFDDGDAGTLFDGTVAGAVIDPLRRATMLPPGGQESDRCVVTVASAGFEGWLDGLLSSVRTRGRFEGAIAVLALGADATAPPTGVAAVAARYGASVVPCIPLQPLSPASKAVMYSAARVVPAERFVLLDADMVVLDDIDPLFAAIDALPPSSLLACNEGNERGIPDLATALDWVYGGGPDPPFFSRKGDLAEYPLVINDGLLAASRDALVALEHEIASMPGAVQWVDARPDVRWRNQFVANVAAAQLGALVELDPVWNLQLHIQSLDVSGSRATWHGRNVRIAHFAGVGKQRHGDLRAAVSAEIASTPPPPSRRATDTSLDDRPWRRTSVPEAALSVPTMLSVDERQLLHWLARDYVTGEGRIVDGGSFLGGSTAALASGLAARSRESDARIASYDRFVVEAYTLEHFGQVLGGRAEGTSFRDVFDGLVAPWSDRIEVREGDICAIGWSGEPIEVLFLDVVKTWAINDLVLDQFVRCLIPGRSIIVQQDYLWGDCPWIHITMELLDGCVRRLDSMPNGSVAYLLMESIPDSVIGLRLRTGLTEDRMKALMERAIGRWDGEERQFVELAAAVLDAELGDVTSAVRRIDAVRASCADGSLVQDSAAKLTARYSGIG